MAGRPGEVGGAQGGLHRRRCGAPARRRSPAQLVGARRGGVVAVGSGLAVALPGGDRPDLQPLRQAASGQLRSDVLTLARKAGVDVGGVYRVDASRRTTAANAYVNGIGHTKRVVLYDNLIEDFPEDQVRMVVAHELGHQARGHLPRARVARDRGPLREPSLAQGAGGAVRAPRGPRRPQAQAAPATLPAIVLSMALVSFVMEAPRTCCPARSRRAPTASPSS